MKRAVFIVVCLVVSLIVSGWLALPRIKAVLRERIAANSRQRNHLPDDALHALVSDPALTLFSVDPDRGTVDPPDISTFHHWVILGQTTVGAPEQRQKLADTLQKGLSHWTGWESAACFSPRHAIRATNGSETFDFLICFECGHLHYYPPNSQERGLQIRTRAGPFDDILIAAGIPMPRQPRQQ